MTNNLFHAMIESQMQLLQKKLVERQEDLLLQLLTGAVCMICFDLAKHIEFGPYEVVTQRNSLEFRVDSVRLSRNVRFLCDQHWTHGECTVAEIA